MPEVVTGRHLVGMIRAARRDAICEGTPRPDARLMRDKLVVHMLAPRLRQDGCVGEAGGCGGIGAT